MTLPEVLIATVIASVVLGGLMGSYQVLQRGFAFSMAWTSTRTAQTRVLHSMALDLRNAIAVTTSTNSDPFITLQIPNRYSTYESSGPFSGDPGLSASRIAPLISSTTGALYYSRENLTVTYHKTGNTIRRQASWVEGGTTHNASRTVGIFPEAVEVSFLNSTGAAFDSNTDTTIVPVISAKSQTYGAARDRDTILTDTVFLRGRAYR